MEETAEGVQIVQGLMKEQFNIPIPKAWTPLIEGWVKKYPLELIKDVIKHSAHVNMRRFSYVDASLKYLSKN